MQNEFEKKVQQQLEQFEVAPGEAVWQKVEAQIKKEKKRRRILFYWVPAAILLIAGGTYFFAATNSDKKIFADRKEEKVTAKPSLEMRAIAPKEKQATQTATLSKGEKSVGNYNNDQINASKKSKLYEKVRRRELVVATSSETSNKSIVEKKVIEKKSANVDNKTSLNERQKDEYKATIASKTIQTFKKDDSLKDTSGIAKNITAEMKTLTIRDSSVTINPADKKAPVVSKKPFKKINWGVTLYTGISNNIDALIGLPTTKSAMDRLSASTVTGAPNYRYVPVTDHFKSSFSFGAGVFVEKNLSKRISISAGINYHSYTVRLSVGEKIDSASSVRDSSLDKSISVNSFYRPGEASFYKNKFHLIELPVSVQWQLNGNVAKPLGLALGITPGLLVASNALYYNPYQQFYYREKDQLRNFQLALQAGLMFTASQSVKYSFQLGPTVKYNVTNLTKTEVGTTEHLFFFGLKTSLLFKK